MRLDAYPVIGPLMDPALPSWSEDAPTGFLRFESHLGVHGLAQVHDRDLHLLAVAAVTPGVGQFRRFIGECKDFYQFIRLWAVVLDDSMRLILLRYGFKRGHDVDRFGEMQEVWDWIKTDSASSQTAPAPAGSHRPCSPEAGTILST